MARHIVCLTFDYDAISGWIARGTTTPTPVSRGEFGVVGTSRVLALLREFDIHATWFVPGHTIETYRDSCVEIVEAGHEIGHHGYAHEAPANLDRAQEDAVLARGNALIEDLTGAPARGYRSPSWDLSPHSVELLLKHGMTYDSSMMADDYTPYRVRQGDVISDDASPRFGRLTPLIEMPVSWNLDDVPHFEYVRYQNRLLAGMQRTGDVLDNWLDEFDYMRETMDWGVLTYTFHPQVIGRGYRMIMLKRLIDGLLERGAVFQRMDAAAAESDRRAPFEVADSATATTVGK